MLAISKMQAHDNSTLDLEKDKVSILSRASTKLAEGDQMSKPLEVSYDVAEVDGLTEARRIVSELQTKVVYCKPAWEKLYRAEKYIVGRQREELEAALSPEAL